MAFLNAHSGLPTHSPGCTANCLVLGQVAVLAVELIQSSTRRLYTLDFFFFFLRLPTGQYGPVSQLSRSEESCTGPFNWGEAHCAGEKVKRKIEPFQWKSLWIKPNSKTTKGRGPPRQPGTPRPGSQVHGPKRKTTTTNKRLHKQILVRLNVLDLQWTVL